METPYVLRPLQLHVEQVSPVNSSSRVECIRRSRVREAWNLSFAALSGTWTLIGRAAMTFAGTGCQSSHARLHVFETQALPILRGFLGKQPNASFPHFRWWRHNRSPHILSKSSIYSVVTKEGRRSGIIFGWFFWESITSIPVFHQSLR